MMMNLSARPAPSTIAAGVGIIRDAVRGLTRQKSSADFSSRAGDQRIRKMGEFEHRACHGALRRAVPVSGGALQPDPVC